MPAKTPAKHPDGDRNPMSNAYVNAPATKLLATNCACCGRSLVDAVSVETGIGPECRKRFGSDVVVNEAARTEANELVALVARRGITRAQAKEVFQRLHALGFTVLAARIAKRFRTTVEVGPSVEELRTRYAVIRTAFCYDNCAPRAFDKLVRDMLPATATPEEFVRAAATVACPCR